MCTFCASCSILLSSLISLLVIIVEFYVLSSFQVWGQGQRWSCHQNWEKTLCQCLFLLTQTHFILTVRSHRQGELETNLRGHTKYLQDCCCFSHFLVPSRKIQEFFDFLFIQLRSSIETKGKSDLESFQLSDNTSIVFRGLSFTHRCNFYPFLVWGKKFLLEKRKFEYSIMCKCHILPWVISTSNSFFLTIYLTLCFIWGA